MTTGHQQRVANFDLVFAQEHLDDASVRRVCNQGIPEGEGRRALAWRVLLSYLESDKNAWQTSLMEQRNLYEQLLNEMILVKGNGGSDESSDHPLNPSPDSHWQTFFKDNEVLLQIDKDVRRLCPDISFFSQPTTYPHSKFLENDRLHLRVHQMRLKAHNLERKGTGASRLKLVKKKANDDYQALHKGQEAHWEVVQRILFLYSKLNPGQSYVQGMNEIIGPLYYVLASDPRDEWRQHAEADCFFCFTNLMADIRDFFIKSLDESESGINSLMIRLMLTLKHCDPSVHERLVQQDIKPQFFAFRWLSLMLSQEFTLPDVLRLWDSLLSDPSRNECLIKICTAMMTLIRDDLLNNDFSENMKLLQNYPPLDIHLILTQAATIRCV